MLIKYIYSLWGRKYILYGVGVYTLWGRKLYYTLCKGITRKNAIIENKEERYRKNKEER